MSANDKTDPVAQDIEEFDLAGCTQLAKGMRSTTYKVDDETILKLFPPFIDADFVSAEREMARSAFVAGIPTAIPFKLVRCGSSYGALYELLDGTTLSEKISGAADDAEAASWGERMADLLGEIHRHPVQIKELRDLKMEAIRRTKALGDTLPSDAAQSIIECFNVIPESGTMVHGQFDPAHIIMRDGQLMLVGMENAGYGHPLFDLVHTFSSCIFPNLHKPDDTVVTIGVSQHRAEVMWDALLRRYFGTDDERAIDAKKKLIWGYAVGVLITSPLLDELPEEAGTPEGLRKMFLDGLLPHLPEMVEASHNLPVWWSL